MEGRHIMSNHIMKFDHVKELFEGTNQGLFVVDENFNIQHYNTKFYNQFSLFTDDSYECNLDEWVGQIHETDRLRVRKSLKDFMENVDGEYLTQQYRIYIRNREVLWVESRAKLIPSDDDKQACIVGIHKDISDEKYIADMLDDLNYVDDLTGLFNQSKLEKVIAGFISEQRTGVLIYLNINDFKLINEIYGETLGDRVLIRVAEILKNHRKSIVSFFRLHGDEFVILIDKDMSIDEIYMFINGLKADIQKRFFIRRKLVSVKVSFGVCRLPMYLDTPFELVQRAKWTMNYAKNHLHNMIAIFDDEIEKSILKKMHIQSEIKSALKNREFYLKFHPIVDTKTWKLKSFETLVRWKSSDWGEIAPDEFIYVAEDNGDILELGQFVLESACEFVKKVKDTYKKNIVVSVNVSVIQLMERQYVSKVMKTLQNKNVDPGSIIIEVTESHMLENSPTMIKKLRLLNKMGIKIALDDFGTGYSSLNSILVLPLSVVKIDRMVMDRVMDRKEIENFIRSVIVLCSQMDLSVVCEGIENSSMITAADELGADFLQGYVFSEPLNENDAIEWFLNSPTKV